MATGFSEELINRIKEDDEVEIETRPAPGRPASRLIIWAVAVDGQVYVRSVRGSAGRWYRNLRANPSGVLYVRGQPVPVRAIPVADAGTIARVSDEYLRKYAPSPYAPPMVRQEVLGTTLRLEPE